MNGSVCLVTGAAGFIGSHLVRALVARGDRVHAIVRPGSSLVRLEDVADAIDLHRFDLADQPALARCVEELAAQKVFHLAATTRDANHANLARIGEATGDYLGPLFNLIDLLSRSARPPSIMVRTGTIAEYGRAEIPYREGGREYPETPYGARMLAATHHIEMLSDRLNFPVVTARLALTYGEGQSSGFLLPALIDACREGKPIDIRRPDDRRDLIHVDDVVEALLLIADRGLRKGLTINVATGVAPTMRKLAELVVKATGGDPALVTFGTPPPGDRPSVLCASQMMAKQQLGWSASIGLEEGLRRILANDFGPDREAGLRCAAQ